jgi:hypothetical protein
VSRLTVKWLMWRTRQKIRLAMWLQHRIEDNIDRVLDEINRNEGVQYRSWTSLLWLAPIVPMLTSL